MKLNRVVITGIGVVSPLGCNTEKMFNNLLDGKTNFSMPRGFKREFDGKEKLVSYVSDDYSGQCRKYGVTQEYTNRSYALLACKQAIESACLQGNRDILASADLHIGTSEGYSFDNLEYMNCDEGELCEYMKGKHPSEQLSEIASEIGIKGEVMAFPVACSGGNVAISISAKKIRYGQKNICIAGGVDHLNETAYTTFHCLGALSETSCKPFDKRRDGITVGEGAGFLVLESLEHARNRRAKIFAEVKGYDISCDAYHLTTPDAEGIMASESMRKAMEMAGSKPEDISFISPHGTGTLSNDQQEANAIFRIFGDLAPRIPVSAIKSMLGHCMGAASAIEAVVAACSIASGKIPQTVNFEHPDDSFPCSIKLNDYGDVTVTEVLSTSFAFGGNISSVVFSKFN